MKDYRKPVLRISLIFAAFILAPLLMGSSANDDDALLGLPTGLTADFGKSKAGVEIIINKFQDDRRDTWFIETHNGKKIKHVALPSNIDLMGKMTDVVMNEFSRADFEVIPGDGNVDPIRFGLSGNVLRYCSVFKKKYTAGIVLEIILTKGDNVLIQNTYLGVAEQDAISSPTPDQVQKINAELMRKAWEDLLSTMMQELIQIINRKS